MPPEYKNFWGLSTRDLLNKKRKLWVDLPREDAYGFPFATNHRDQVLSVKSIGSNQHQILVNIIRLHVPTKQIDVDLTYGNGQFYENPGLFKFPRHCFDIRPKFKFVKKADYTKTVPIKDEAVESVVIDPPFLTYVKKTNTSRMARRFSGFWSLNELADNYRNGLCECQRILQRNGVLIFKCQDIIHNHKLWPAHVQIIQWAAQLDMRLLDLFVLTSNGRMDVVPSNGKRGVQKHARIWHCYFLVFKKVRPR